MHSRKAQGRQAVLLDLDGTLVDTLDDFALALQAMLTDLGAPWCDYRLQRQAIEPLVGKGSENLVIQALALVQKARDAPENVADAAALQQRAVQSYLAHYRGINGRHAQVYAGVREALAGWQQQGAVLACVTNKPTLYARELLERVGLSGYFVVVIGGDAVARKKPDPMALLLACQQLDCLPAQTLMVGDSSNDVQAARAAGCPVVLVRYGYNHGEPAESAGADRVIDSLAELLPP